MESGIESDPEDDPSSQNDATRAAATAVAALQVYKPSRPTSSSIDQLIESLMVPPPPPSASPPVDADTLNQLTQLVQTSPPSIDRVHRSPCSVPPDDIIYSNLVIPPPPPRSRENDADLEAFLAKIVACNGIIGPETLNGISVVGNRYFGRQLSEPVVHSGPRQLPATQSTRADNGATVSDVPLLPHSVPSREAAAHYRCTSVISSVEGQSRTQKEGYFAQTSMAGRSVCEDPPAIRTSDTDERLDPYNCTGVMNDAARGMLRNNIDGHSGSVVSQSGTRVSQVPSAAGVTSVNKFYGCAPDVQSLQEYRRRCDGMPPVSGSTVLSATLPWRDDVWTGGTLTRTMGRRRPPPPPPPRTSSVQNSPAMSCRSEQLTRRRLPPAEDRLTPLPTPPSLARSPPPRAAETWPRTVELVAVSDDPRLGPLRAGTLRPSIPDEDRLTPLPTTPSLARSPPLRPGPLRSSFTDTNQPTAVTSSNPSSPNWNFRRSHSLTESATTTTAKSGKRPSLLAAIGSRLRSYWSPSPSRHLRDRPATATGGRQSANHRRLQLEVPSHSQYGVVTRLHGELLTNNNDDDDDETYLSFSIPLNSRQLQTSPTMTSFSSFTGE